ASSEDRRADGSHFFRLKRQRGYLVNERRVDKPQTAAIRPNPGKRAAGRDAQAPDTGWRAPCGTPARAGVSDTPQEVPRRVRKGAVRRRGPPVPPPGR